MSKGVDQWDRWVEEERRKGPALTRAVKDLDEAAETGGEMIKIVQNRNDVRCLASCAADAIEWLSRECLMLREKCDAREAAWREVTRELARGVLVKPLKRGTK